MRQVSRRESLTSIALLVLLPIVAGAVYWKGQNFDPNLFALDPSLLGKTTGGVISLPQEVEGLDFLPDGDEEFFEASNVHEKINGRAELYFEHGFVSLQFLSYMDSAESQFIDVFLYEMTAPENASDLYTLEKPPEDTSVSLGEEGYRVEASHFFWRGRYYVQVIVGDVGPELEKAALELARKTDEAIRGRP